LPIYGASNPIHHADIGPNPHDHRHLTWIVVLTKPDI
jgi:hypothetical protein